MEHGERLQILNLFVRSHVPQYTFSTKGGHRRDRSQIAQHPMNPHAYDFIAFHRWTIVKLDGGTFPIRIRFRIYLKNEEKLIHFRYVVVSSIHNNYHELGNSCGLKALQWQRQSETHFDLTTKIQFTPNTWGTTRSEICCWRTRPR